MLIRPTKRDEAVDGTTGGGAATPEPKPEPTAEPKPEPSPAELELAQLKQREIDLAPFIEAGRKQHRDQLAAALIGASGKLLPGTEAAFQSLLSDAARSLGIDLDRPVSDEQRSQLVLKLAPVTAGIIQRPAPIHPPGVSTYELAPNKPTL